MRNHGDAAMLTDAERAVDAAVAVIRARTLQHRPRVGLVLGSGLGRIAERIGNAVTIPYDTIPGFPRPTVAGHAGHLVVGELGGQTVACMQGRVHAYEGKGFAALRLAIRALHRLGCGTLVLTCAAGSLDVDVGPGRLMLIRDHINLLGVNPLTGPNDDAFGPRFPSLTDAWAPSLRAVMQEAAADMGLPLAEGVYAALSGPCFETPAEVKMLKILGADAVGMSTVPECIIARHCGMAVTGCAVITNLGVGLGDEKVSHAHTLAQASVAASDLERLLIGFLKRLG